MSISKQKKEVMFPGTTSKERRYLIEQKSLLKENFNFDDSLNEFRVKGEKIKEENWIVKNEGSNRKFGKLNYGIPYTKYENVKGAFGLQDPSEFTKKIKQENRYKRIKLLLKKSWYKR